MAPPRCDGAPNGRLRDCPDGMVMMSVRRGRLLWALALVVAWAGRSGLSASESVVVGTGSVAQTIPGSAAVYCWGQSDWVKISPEPGAGLGAQAAVHSLCDFRGQLFAGTDGGHVYAYANGTTWNATGLNGSEIPTEATVLSLATYRGDLYAGTQAAGLYRYDSNTSRWSKVGIDLHEMQGAVAMTAWTDPVTQESQLYLGDVYHDMIIAYNGSTADRELSVFAPVGSCIWDFQAFNDHLYASSYQGRVYVRLPDCVPGSEACWVLATPPARGYSNALAMEVFQGNLYVACDGTLERVVKEESSWSSLRFARVFPTGTSDQGRDHIKAMVAADDLYFGTEQGRVYRYEGQQEPVRLGPAIPSVFAIHAGALSAGILKVERVEILLEGCVSRGGPLTYRIEYVLSGESAGTVSLVEGLPSDVEVVVASPEPNQIEGRYLTWDLGKVVGGTLRGSLSVTVRPKSEWAKGSELVDTCLVLDGTAYMGGTTRRTLYGVERLYVDPNSPQRVRDGCSWETAFRTVSEALRRADAYLIPEVWVAEGVYELPEETRDEYAVGGLTVSPGVALRGGFAGHEQSIQERVLGDHPTVLTCAGVPQGIVISDTGWRANPDPQCSTETLIEGITLRGPGPGSQVDGISATTDGEPGLVVRNCIFEKCFHGLFLADGSGATIEGCVFKTTVFGVSASGTGAVVDVACCLFQEGMCGAYLGEGASVTVRGCTLARNGPLSMWDDKYAGGIVAFCDDVNVTDCHFSGNRGHIGGGLYVSLPEGRAGMEVRISRCEFVGNTAVRVPESSDERSTGEGGGLFIDRRDFIVTDSWFAGNSSPVAAGAFGCCRSSGRVVRSFFYGNQAAGPDSSCGGAIEFGYQQGPVGVYRSVFADNRAPYAGAVACTANGDHPTELVNCTFVKNQGTYWAGGALSVCSEKVDQRTTVGSRAAVTNCLFYGNTGKVDGAVMEVYAGSTLTLACSAMDGAWYRPAVVWVELDQQKRPLGQVEVNDADAMQILSGSPFRAEVVLDYHLRRPSTGETVHPSDGGLAMTVEDVSRDLDGDPVPLGSGWDIGADELDPNGDATCGVWPAQVVCDCTAQGASDLPITFRSARYGEDAASDPDRVALVRMAGCTPQTVALIPVVRGGQGVVLDTTTPGGLADGHVTFSVTTLDLRSGVYMAQLVHGSVTPVVRAVSCRFFVRSTPPDPTASVGNSEPPL